MSANASHSSTARTGHGVEAANVVVKAEGELLMQLYGLFDEPLRFSPEGVSLMLCRLPRTGGRPRLSLSTPAIYAWLERESLIDPACLLWRGRPGMRDDNICPWQLRA